ncbi:MULTISPECIES: RdgB/HAM1 family non-canonical purine NTP pyrophosphatase [Mumia]|uniref:RdgB/HAM1 family non-canonical purine NTP pyrophosphatase n=1 Tax=Mumia TaxID=1546255 RepID=UPI00141DC613|nr:MULTISPECIES: RdgB/HAM1 family non-canonical purine NTP pyrophosphatase [unclassified Mumia]QMW65487.1 RdgB/HAM1 family non-canonical purine NTP pyrophosphatase [Mumia sp. ZJ1417]
MSEAGRRVVLASHNTGKLAELRRILEPELPGIEVLGLGDIGDFAEPVEDQPTFEGNALLKARAAAKATGLPSLADDSGLCVDALNGMPGVLSARWGGRPKSDARNNALLLDQLADVPDERRGAEFRCAMALTMPSGAEVVEIGIMRGRIQREATGDGGFGYDPLFAADGYDVSTAELTPADKDAISHRGNALRAMVPHLVALLA